MPIFKYKAITATGARVEGTHEAHSKKEILQLLQNNQQFPVSIEEITIGQQDVDLFERFKKVSTKDISVFCRQFYTMLHAGVTILNCLEILKHQTENKKMKSVLAGVDDNVQKGLTLSEAMKLYKKDFPELLVNMVAVGEVSGNLDQIMDRMAIHYEKENRMNSKLKSAMIYPAALAVVALSVVTFLLIFVMPTFVGMFASSGVQLPLPTRILLGLSYGLIHYGLIILAVLVAIIFGLKTLAQTDDGKRFIDQAKLNLPLLKGITQKVVTTRFTRTMATLLASGVPLIQAIEVVSKVVGNYVVEHDLMQATFDVRKGISLSVPLKKMGHFPPMVYYMVTIGEESGSLDDILNRTATYYDDELEDALVRFTALLEPIMIVFMAVIVGSIAVAMVMPMFDMLQTVN